MDKWNTKYTIWFSNNYYCRQPSNQTLLFLLLLLSVQIFLEGGASFSAPASLHPFPFLHPDRDPRPAPDPNRNVRIRSPHLQHPRRLPGGHRPWPPLWSAHHRRLQQSLPMRNPRWHQDAPLCHRVWPLPPKRCVSSFLCFILIIVIYLLIDWLIISRISLFSWKKHLLSYAYTKSRYLFEELKCLFCRFEIEMPEEILLENFRGRC